MIRAFNSGFAHALKHEQKFMKNGNPTRNANVNLSENIINENNLEEAIE